MAAAPSSGGPGHDSAAGRHRDILVVVLAATTGATDAMSFLGLGGVFTSVMTANLVLLGVSAGQRSGALAVHVGTAVAASGRSASPDCPPRT